MKEESLYRKRERGNMHFSGRTSSRKGVTGFVLSLLAVAAVIALCVVSAIAGGAAGEIVGVLGLLTMAMSGVALSLCLKGLKERDVYTGIPFAGLLISGILFVFLFCLYVLGIRF